MLQTLRDAWNTREIRKKILFTLLIVVIFRIGAFLPVPFLDASAIAAMLAESEGGTIMNILDTFSGGALSQGSLFALSIQPYINASIIMQLLTYALPPLENLSKEGETGRKKIQFITSIVSLVIACVMAYAYYMTMRSLNAVTMFEGTFANVFVAIIIVASFAAGAQLVIWLGNRINENGLGSGISILLFTGIISRGPSAIFAMFEAANADKTLYIALFFVLLFFIAMVGFIVFMNDSERRIPVTYAKRVVGRKQYGGQSSYIPIKIAMSGVMPIIFAMAVMTFPGTIEMFIKPNPTSEAFWDQFYVGFLNFFNYNNPWYAPLYFVLIVAFNFFYVSMQYDPTKIANQLRGNNGGIPGIRPGKPTADYIKRVLGKITIVGAFFLGVIAIVPILTGVFITQIRISMGGTTILIIVSVILETIRMLQSQMMMRHHKGFLE